MGLMSGIVEVVRRLLTDGSLVLSEQPIVQADARGPLTALLAGAFSKYRLEIAGPPLEFDAPTALAAAELVCLAGWFLLVRSAEADVVERGLRLPSPASAAEQASADFLLRYLPAIYRRAWAVKVDDVLTRTLAHILRQWPLSGILAGVNEGPLTPVDFEGHPGLLLLYAERLADNLKPDWIPHEGLAREWVERVFAERNLPVVTRAESQPGRETHGR
jgi:hypothetical protein